MTRAEFRAELERALELRDAFDGYPTRPDDPVWTFVSQGPHGLPIRPRLLAEHENGERVYSVNRRQAQKLLGLLGG